jgi:RNA 2',3'-cyclic 3'-phosphodiesterase
MEETWRTFIAIDPGKPLRSKIDQLQTRLQNKTGPGVRWVNPDQVHLTLKFLGDVPVSAIDPLAQALKNACSAAKPFELTLEGSGCFPSYKKPNAIWLGLSGGLPALQALQQSIERETDAFSAHKENRGFSPHLTIGRVKARLAREQQRIGAVLEGTSVGVLGSFPVGDVLLIRSLTLPEGPRYTTLARAALGNKSD